MLAQIQDNTYKAYVALQSYATAPSNIPIPGVIRTDRPKLTRAQMADRYLKSVEGNPNIDINKANIEENQKMPRMVQKSESTLTKRQWPTAAHPEATDEMKTRQTSRTLLDSGTCYSGPSLDDYKKYAAQSANLTHEAIGVPDEHSACMMDLPEFVVCSDQYLPLADFNYMGYPSRELQYRPVRVPNIPVDNINADIHKNLNINKATRIYLTPKQLDSYLAWRLKQGEGINFQYIKVEDAQNDTLRILACAVGAFLGAGVVMTMGAGLRTIIGTSSTVASRKTKKDFQASDTLCSSANQPSEKQSAAVQNLKRNEKTGEISGPGETNAPSGSLTDPSVLVNISTENSQSEDSTKDDTAVYFENKVPDNE